MYVVIHKFIRASVHAHDRAHLNEVTDLHLALSKSVPDFFRFIDLTVLYAHSTTSKDTIQRRLV